MLIYHLKLYILSVIIYTISMPIMMMRLPKKGRYWISDFIIDKATPLKKKAQIYFINGLLCFALIELVEMFTCESFVHRFWP